MSYLTMAMGIVIVLLLGALGIAAWQLKVAWQDVATLEANVAVAEAAVKEQREVLAEVQSLYAEEQRKTFILQTENTQIVEDRDEAVEKLNKYRGRLGSAAIGRPGLVERKANRATKQVFCDFNKLTGGEACAEAQ